MTHCDSMSREQLRDLFVYEDGLLLSKKTGKPVGHVRKDGRRLIGINRKSYLAYRLIWMYHYGDIPKIIDHIDRNTSNDKIENLRPASKSENGQNRMACKKNSKTQVFGVYYDKSRQKYAAEIILNRKKTHLGRFDTAEEAHAAYIAAKQNMHPAWSRDVFA